MMRQVVNPTESAASVNGSRPAYWAATLLFAVFMAYDARALIAGDPGMMAELAFLGYPAYFALVLGVAKFLGIAAILIPGAPRLKEWAYAGFTFTFLGAILSHVAAGQRREAVLPFAALVIMAFSYLLRPPLRRILEAASAVR
jgi:hypothetical protein